MTTSTQATGTRRQGAPVWLMGLTNSVFGMYGGLLVITLPQLLSARGVPEATIASMTAVTISPGFWAFLFSPVLDVRFSRRWYSVFTAVAAATLLAIALLNLDDPPLVEILLVTGFFFGNLYQSALGGWLASIITTEEENRMSVWVTIANISGGGIMAMMAGELVRRLPPTAAALALGCILLLPTAVFPWMPAPGPDRRLARERFAEFFAAVVGILRRRDVLIAILLFIAPPATFSLVNLLGGLGPDFHASASFVGVVGGAGVAAGGIAGCFIFRLIDRLLPLRLLFLAIGAVGALFTLTLIVLPRTPATFALALIGENLFQSTAITASIAIIFDSIGRGNPLSATTFGLLISSFNISNTYMLLVDGWGYSLRGVAGGYAADAAVSLSACLLLAAFLIALSRHGGLPTAQRARTSD